MKTVKLDSILYIHDEKKILSTDTFVCLPDYFFVKVKKNNICISDQCNNREIKRNALHKFYSVFRILLDS